MTDRDPTELVAAYYEAVDEDAPERLTDLLAPGFTHVRTDRTLEGRDAFVSFMAEERPVTGTRHEVGTVYRAGDESVAAEGTLRHPDGSAMFGFVDVFVVETAGLARLTTYVNERLG